MTTSQKMPYVDWNCEPFAFLQSDRCAPVGMKLRNTKQSITHLDLARFVRQAVDAAGYYIIGESYKLSHGNCRMFGVLDLSDKPFSGDEKICMCIVIRNCLDGLFSGQIAIGFRLWLHSSIGLLYVAKTFRQSAFAIERLKKWSDPFSQSLKGYEQQVNIRLLKLRETTMSDGDAASIMVNATYDGICRLRDLLSVVGKVRAVPRDRLSAFDLYESFIRIMKRWLFLSPHTAVPALLRLNQLFDDYEVLNGQRTTIDESNGLCAGVTNGKLMQ